MRRRPEAQISSVRPVVGIVSAPEPGTGEVGYFILLVPRGAEELHRTLVQRRLVIAPCGNHRPFLHEAKSGVLGSTIRL